MTCMRVDLPDPEGPMIAVNAPAAMSIETWSRAVTAVLPAPYVLVSSRVRTAGAVVAWGRPVAGVTGVLVMRGSSESWRAW